MDIDIASFPLWYVAFLFSLTCHEAAHALAAKVGGDLTAYHAGQVSLNPLPHIRREVWGTVLMPILSYVVAGSCIGWGSAPYDPYWEQRYPRRAAWMALAGPVANMVLVLIAGLVMRGGMAAGWFQPAGSLTYSQIVMGTDIGSAGVATFLSIMFTLNVLLALFNLVPLPPLDGASVISLVMPVDIAEKYRNFIRQPFLQMFGVLIALYVARPFVDDLIVFALRLVYGSGLAN